MQHHMDEMLNDLAREQELRTLHEAEDTRAAMQAEYEQLQRELIRTEGYEAMKSAAIYATYADAEDAYYIREAEAAGYSDYEGFGEVAA